MRGPSVEDVGMTHSRSHGTGAGLDLGNHASGGRARRHQPVEVGVSDTVDQGGRVVRHRPQSGHIGQEDQLLGFEGTGQRAGGGVGIDVEGLARLVGPDGGHHRDESLGQQLVDDDRIDVHHVTDIAQGLRAGGGGDQIGVLARQPDGQRGVHVDRAHDVAVDLPHQHHPDQVDGVGVGDPETVEELDLFAHPLHEGADLRTTTVDDDGKHADGAHEHDVLGERGQRRCLVDLVLPRLGAEDVAAVLDDHHLPPETADVGQGFDQYRCFVPRGQRLSGGCRSRTMIRPGGHEVVRFSSIYP